LHLLYTGNRNLNFLTGLRPHELKITLMDWEGQTRYAHYDAFSVGAEADKFPLTLGDYSGNAGENSKRAKWSMLLRFMFQGTTTWHTITEGGSAPLTRTTIIGVAMTVPPDVKVAGGMAPAPEPTSTVYTFVDHTLAIGVVSFGTIGEAGATP
jgi:hypothetical protein